MVHYPSGIEVVFPQGESSDEGKEVISFHKFACETPETGASSTVPENDRKRRMTLWIIAGATIVTVVLAAVLVPIGILVLKYRK